jgi:hypothetical protein
MSEHRDQKRIEPDQGEKRGLVIDVVVPIAQTAAGVWVGNKLGGQKPPPPQPKKEE